MNLKILSLILLLLLGNMMYGRSTESYNAALLDSIERESSDMARMDALLHHVIDSLSSERNAMPVNRQRVLLTEELGLRYVPLNIDSALIYLELGKNEARLCGDDASRMRLNLFSLCIQPLAGIVPEALDNFKEISTEHMDREMRRTYWICAAELLNNVAKMYPDGLYKNNYMMHLGIALDSLSTYYDTGSPVFAYIDAQKHRLRGQESISIAALIDLLPRLESHSTLYVRALEEICRYYQDRPAQRAVYENYILRLCLYELRHGLHNPRTLALAGRVLDNAGRSNAAQRIISEATTMEETGSYNGRVFDRSAYSTFLYDKYRRTRHVLIAVVVALCAAIIYLIYLIHRMRANSRRENMKLSSDSRSFLQQITGLQKINRCIVAIATLWDEQFKDLNIYVLRKLKSGQVKDLYRELETGEYVKQQYDKFNITFDDAYLSIFPDFVPRLNSLLSEDKQIALPSDKRLTPELRIAALIHLGVTDSSRLAQILNLSINTIYTYRNRLRGRAVNRENFEENLSSKTI